MNSLIEKVVLAGFVLQAPLRYEGEPVDHATATAVNVHAARRDRGTLLYCIGVQGSAILPLGYNDANLPVKKWHEDRLRASGESRIAEAFHRPGYAWHCELRGGPTIFVTHPEDLSPPNGHAPILYSLTPVLVPDYVHMEHLHEDLMRTSLPANLIHDACRIVTEVRAQARFMVA